MEIITIGLELLPLFLKKNRQCQFTNVALF